MRLSEPLNKRGGYKRGNKKHRSFAAMVAALFAVLMIGCAEKQQGAGNAKPAGSNQPNRTAVIETDLGTIKFELLEDEAPRTARQSAGRSSHDILLVGGT